MISAFEIMNDELEANIFFGDENIQAKYYCVTQPYEQPSTRQDQVQN